MSRLITPEDRIFVAGHRGMAGSAILRRLEQGGYDHRLTADRHSVDLTDPATTTAWFAEHRPDVVVLAAAKVGGIQANATYPADFLLDNLKIQNNVIEAAWRHGARRLLFLGSSCIYPKFAEQPIREEALLTGPLEPTNEPYAIAKIAGLKLCESFQRQHGRGYVSVIPASLYGPNDNYDPANSHVLPALLRRAHEARERGDPELVVWGTGTPRREFLYVDDLARACVMLAEQGYAGPPINIGSGSDLSIRELAEAVVRTVGYRGRLVFDASKPDGIARKLLDSSRMLATGWRPQVPLPVGLELALRASRFARHQTTVEHE